MLRAILPGDVFQKMESTRWRVMTLWHKIWTEGRGVEAWKQWHQGSRVQLLNSAVKSVLGLHEPVEFYLCLKRPMSGFVFMVHAASCLCFMSMLVEVAISSYTRMHRVVDSSQRRHLMSKYAIRESYHNTRIRMNLQKSNVCPQSPSPYQ